MRVRSNALLTILVTLLLVIAFLFSENRPEFSTQLAIPFFSAEEPDTEIVDDAAISEAEEAEEEPSEQLDDFGIDTEQFRVAESRIRRGKTFTDLVTGLDVPYSEAVSIADSASPVFDVRRLRAGRSYRVYTDKWLNQPRYLVYQQDAVRYVTFDLMEGTVEAGEREVRIVEKEASGTISSSLYQTVSESGAHSSLVFALSEMFAWQVDFHRVQPGDNFNVVYEQEMVGDKVIGTGKIVAARFEHNGHSNYGIYFENEEQSGYFDENGQSLRKQLLQAPLQYTRISSGYSRNRRHPITGRNRPHLGTDYAAPHGTPIHSVGDGVVIEASRSRGNGNFVRIRHNSTYTTQYLHMSRFAEGIRAGTHVKQGETIGYVGSTGLATGPHVCFRFWKDGRQVNHRELEMPPSEPIEDEYMDAYMELADELIERVNRDDRTVAEEKAPSRSTSRPTASAR